MITVRKCLLSDWGKIFSTIVIIVEYTLPNQKKYPLLWISFINFNIYSKMHLTEEQNKLETEYQTAESKVLTLDFGSKYTN